MKRIKIEGEISARQYKRLLARLKPLGRRALWSILDHYLFHAIQDKDVDELLQILDEHDRTGAPITAAALNAIPADEPERPDYLRPKFPDTLTPDDLEANRDRLNLMFDVGYFDYVEPSDVPSVAKKLIDFCSAHEIPMPAHWRLLAQGGQS